MTPTVSVCISAYQHARFIAQALDSVLAQQTTFPVEILVGEDESTDGTRAIVADYERRHPDRVRAFYRSRRDVIYYAGRPTGRHNFVATLAEAKGRYVAFLDGDDFWTDPHKLQRQVDSLEQAPDCTLGFHGALAVDSDGGTLGRFGPRRPRRRYTVLDLTTWLDLVPATVMLRRTAIPALEPWYLQLPVGDFPLWLMCLGQGDAAYVDADLAAYRCHAGGRWWSLGDEARRSQALLVTRLLRPHVSPRLRAALDARAALMQGRQVATALRAGHAREALTKAVEAARTCREDGRSLPGWAAAIATAGLGAAAGGAERDAMIYPSVPWLRGRGGVREPWVSWLSARGAGAAEHTGRTLLDHLAEVNAILEAWEAPAHVQAAGLFHSVYGTETFATPLVPLAERAEVRRLVGEQAERLVYLFCALPPLRLAGVLGVGAAAPPVDRFTGEAVTLAEDVLRDSAYLHLADHVEQLPAGIDEDGRGPVMRAMALRLAGAPQAAFARARTRARWARLGRFLRRRVAALHGLVR